MRNKKSQWLNRTQAWLHFIPYLTLGTVVFIFNSETHLNYFMRGYLVLLESQIGLVLIYFIIAKIVKRNRRKLKKATTS